MARTARIDGRTGLSALSKAERRALADELGIEPTELGSVLTYLRAAAGPESNFGLGFGRFLNGDTLVGGAAPDTNIPRFPMGGVPDRFDAGGWMRSDPGNPNNPGWNTPPDDYPWLGPQTTPTRAARIASTDEWFVPDINGNTKPDRKSTRLNSSHVSESRMPSSA